MLFNIISNFFKLFKIDPKPKSSINLFNLATEKSNTYNEEMISIFSKISALKLLYTTLKEHEKNYRELYNKATKNLVDGKNNSKQKEIHKIADVYYKNIIILENELKLVESALTSYNRQLLISYLKLDTLYDNYA